MVNKVTITYKPYKNAMQKSDPDLHKYLAKGGEHFHIYFNSECVGVFVTFKAAMAFVMKNTYSFFEKVGVFN
jgi:hypothetical protein